MEDLEEWEKKELDFVLHAWSEEDEALWNKLLPYVKEALFFSTMREFERIEARIANMPGIEPSDDCKIKMNKLFKDTFGETKKDS